MNQFKIKIDDFIFGLGVIFLGFVSLLLSCLSIDITQQINSLMISGIFIMFGMWFIFCPEF